METAIITNPAVEVVEQSPTSSVVVTSGSVVPVVVQSGDFAVVQVEESTVTLGVGGLSTAGTVAGDLALEQLTNVIGGGRADGSVLAFDAESSLWAPVNLQRNQIYDGGNF